MYKLSKKPKRYIPALDGLRAVAVLAVIAYHLDMGWASGGFVGVGVFFVLSGYLITDLLISEWRVSGRINLAYFWLRRGKRLLPAMLTMLMAVVFLLAVLDRSRLANLWGELWAAMLYVSNWQLIARQVSYFESFGPPSPLGHLWSLAVEEQFYLIWPFAMALLLSFTRKRSRLLLAFLAGALLSALAMAFLYDPGSDPSRVYYGTDTRAFALLIGAALAVVRPSEGRDRRAITRSGKIALELCGAAGFLTVLLMIMQTDEYAASLYRGGLVLLSVATALLIGAIVHPASAIGRLLSCRPLRWAGVRSYGLYLWHYPVIVMTTPAVQTDGPSLLLTVFQVAMSVLLSALSWRFIEQPVKNGVLGRLWKRMKEYHGSLMPLQTGKNMHGAVFLGVLIVLCVFSSGSVGVGAKSAVNSGPAQTALSAGNPAYLPKLVVERGQAVKRDPPSHLPIAAKEETEGQELPGTPLPSPAEQTPAVNPAPSTPASTAPADAANEAEDPGTDDGSNISIIGDSVILDVEPYLKEELPGIVIDGLIGRQLSQAAEVVDQLRAEERLGERVVIELGTNGVFPEKQLRGLLDSLNDVEQIVLLNTRVPKKWQDAVNQTLSEVVRDYPKAVLVDWHGHSAGQDDYFEKDGVHLKPKGAEAYASLLLEAIR